MLRIETRSLSAIARRPVDARQLGLDGAESLLSVDADGRLVAQGTPFAPGEDREIRVGDATLEVGFVSDRCVDGGPKAERDVGAMAGFTATVSVHAGLLAALVLFPPPIEDAAAIEAAKADRSDLNARMERAESTEAASPQSDLFDVPLEPGGEPGGRARSNEARMGRRDAAERTATYAISGTAPRRSLLGLDPAFENAKDAIADARSFVMIGLVQTAVGERDGAFEDVAFGRDPADARGNMWGPEMADAFGEGGLGLSGTGEGGGGRAVGVGLLGDGGPDDAERGDVEWGGTPSIGYRRGLGRGYELIPICHTDEQGRCEHAHIVRSPRVSGAVDRISGRLPPEVIQRIVRHNFGRFRLCYEDVLRERPRATGRVVVSFMIDLDGAVSSAVATDSTFPEHAMASCVASGFAALTFPAPEGGIVSVTYPIAFAPS